MKMKYFRFLYGKTRSCLIHFGEVKDTRSNETFTFLFLRGNEEQDDQAEGQSTIPFLYPERIDLVVLGNLSDPVKAAWEEIETCVKVGTLVVPDSSDWNGQSDPERVGQVIQLGYCEVGHESREWQFDAAGWRLRVICWTEGALALWHDLEKRSRNVQGLEEAATGLYDECVMSMKSIESDSKCCRNQNPDAYGCALGCTLHRDYDVCKYRYADETNPYLTGTLLTAGKGSEAELASLKKDLMIETDRIRFFSLQDLESEICGILPEKKSVGTGMRRYYIGTDQEMTDRPVAEICRNGFNSIPVILGDGRGVCCSGFLKYSEE